KLRYVDRLVRQIGFRPPRPSSDGRGRPVSGIRKTLGQYYEWRMREARDRSPKFYDSELERIFAGSSRGLAGFFREYRSLWVETVSYWTGEKKYTINKMIDRLEEHCRRLKIGPEGNRIRGAMNVASFLTSHSVRHRYLAES